jgi:hypothetical protein
MLTDKATGARLEDVNFCRATVENLRTGYVNAWIRVYSLRTEPTPRERPEASGVAALPCVVG